MRREHEEDLSRGVSLRAVRGNLDRSRRRSCALREVRISLLEQAADAIGENIKSVALPLRKHRSTGRWSPRGSRSDPERSGGSRLGGTTYRAGGVGGRTQSRVTPHDQRCRGNDECRSSDKDVEDSDPDGHSDPHTMRVTPEPLEPAAMYQRKKRNTQSSRTSFTSSQPNSRSSQCPRVPSVAASRRQR